MAILIKDQAADQLIRTRGRAPPALNLGICFAYALAKAGNDTASG
jgi:uncharacterized protein with PIN domain